jgi:hypothetical protein
LVGYAKHILATLLKARLQNRQKLAKKNWLAVPNILATLIKARLQNEALARKQDRR